ncbi:hypothetical protein [Pyxidicoccus xibeiensis]|uniref:hypothetical protein n=1 Tax=Pyxidicoccus xibeiensis TaxID=2906759 RepID=UPI0020A7624F|nr:hypothetical protein [Pyxidicoccus xibeiensis]MCP3138368.1 hypothetical protein [Pyxidicoccus xibeiensis]
MKPVKVLAGVLVLGLLAGCGPVASDELEPIDTSGEASVEPSLSPELVELLADRHRPSDEVLAYATAICPASNSCVGYDSCGTWSSFANCGAVGCIADPGCRLCSTCDVMPRKYQSRYRYQVCFNQLQQSCTKYELITVQSCGGCAPEEW